MLRRLLTILFFCAGLLSTANASAGSKKPSEVQDLHYGEVLFHFYQQDYFTAITHLLAARQQEQLPHHRQEAELLLGGLQLSYGMRRQAQDQFMQVLDNDSDPRVRNRVWYYLGKIAYQRGHYDDAHTSLNRVDGETDADLSAERYLLLANTNMQLGQNESAAEVLKKARAPKGLREYLQINRAIALLRAGNVDAGRELLDDIGRDSASTEELRALRDRASLALGYELLRAGHAEQARVYLNRVRLNGPFAAAALLGAGWADAERGAYELALTPWLELSNHSSFDAPVQEVQLAIPYAFERMGDQARAIHFYKTAINYFDNEQSELNTAVETVHSGLMLQLLNQFDGKDSGGWLYRNPTLQGIPASEYLVDLMAANRFQETLKQYRDLTFLDRLIAERLDNIDVFHDMVDARRLAYQQRSPVIRDRLQREESQALQARWDELHTRLQQQQLSKNPLGLATSPEAQQWSTLEQARQRLSQLPDQPRFTKMADRARWLQGVLFWNIHSDYPDRLWQTRKALAELEQPLQEARTRHAQVAALLDSAEAGFRGYDERIDALRQRLLTLKEQVKTTQAAVGTQIESLALDELEQRRKRVESYRSQARYALARNYDQLASRTEEQP